MTGSSRQRIMAMVSPLCILSLWISQSTAFAPALFVQATTSCGTRLALANNNAEASPIIIAMTREEGKNEKLRKHLQQQLTTDDKNSAVDLVELPCIAHANGPDLDQLADLLWNDNKWDYVVVTSPEAARVLASAWNNNPKELKTSKVPAVAVVGKATQAVLEKAGIPVVFCPSVATAKVLVQELPPVVSSKNDDNGQATATSVLYPASAKAATTLQDGLTARGFDVTRLNTYDTVTATWTKEQLATAQQTTVVCVASPTSIQGWLANAQRQQQSSSSSDDESSSSVPSPSLLAACIGETSAQACRELGFEESQIFYAEKPGIPGWVHAVQEALDHYYSSSSSLDEASSNTSGSKTTATSSS